MRTGVLGIDTSCYTTSCALAADGEIVSSARRLLTVKQGERGLRQSDGVFQHVGNLPEMVDETVRAAGNGVRIGAVCVSARPRDAEGSYMPVFTVGLSTARSIAAALNVPLIETTHQQGHVRAAMVGTGLTGAHLALHLSGGTTEVLDVAEGLRVTCIGGTADLNAGQFIDRAGVRLGLSFPAGPQVEALAKDRPAKGLLPLSARDGLVSFSGAEAQVMRMADSGDYSNEEICAEVFGYVARAIVRLIADAVEKTGKNEVLLAGGVASSVYLRTLVAERAERKKVRAKLYWARPELSGCTSIPSYSQSARA